MTTIRDLVEETISKISPSIKDYYLSLKNIKEKDKVIRTSDVLFDEHEVLHLLRVVLSGWISQGPEVKQFESDFADYYGVKYAISVNSGSSANLVAMAALSHESLGDRGIKHGDEVITPPVTFPTSVFPIIQMGAVPVFVDVDPETFCIDPRLVEEAFTEKTKCVLPVHLLGHPCDMPNLPKGDCFLMEDACESHGAECYGRKVGTWGDFGTFSFFTAHHMTTGEGGMILTNDNHLVDLARSLRGFGRVTEVAKDPHSAQQLGVRYKEFWPQLGLFDIRQTFDKVGYAMKMTDLQAALGIEQLRKLDHFIELRRKNAFYLKKQLEPYEDLIQLPVEKPWAKNTFHHFTVIVREDAPFTRLDLVNYLEAHGIETRPIEAGNMADQPCMRGLRYRVVGDLHVAKHVRKDGFFIGCHSGLDKENLDRIIDVFVEFVEKHARTI